MVCGAACPAFLGGVRASARTWGAPFAPMEQREGAARLWRRRRMPSWSMWCRVDHVSGYFHVKLTEGSRTYFGFEWGSVYYVCKAVLNFGWKPAPYIYIYVVLRGGGRVPSPPCPPELVPLGRHGYVRTHSPARPRACPGLAGRGFPSISLAEVGPDPGAESGIG